MMQSNKIVCFGEVLWDILPDGAVPGGAPMNVAYHLHKMGLDPTLITCVGDDDHGRKLIQLFRDNNISTDFFQIDNEYETGKVIATPGKNNEVQYDILKPVAWDFIKWSFDLNQIVADSSHFIFGSLAARSEQTRKTLFRLLEVAKIKVLDINLRPPHFTKEIVEELLSKADILKCNATELVLISSWEDTVLTLENQIQVLAKKYKLQTIVVTKGEDGAVLLHEEKLYKHPGIKVKVTDTIGSGDAFLAGLLSQLLKNISPSDALAFANRLGAFVATQKGACPVYDRQQVLSF